MCAINGAFAYHYAANPVDRAEIVATRDHMQARGPDGCGLWVAPNERVGFGHRRLAIIDLLADGAQPLVMRILYHEKTLAASGSAAEEGRRPTIVAGPEVASSELLAQPRRRYFKARDKLLILAEADAAGHAVVLVSACVCRDPSWCAKSNVS